MTTDQSKGVDLITAVKQCAELAEKAHIMPAYSGQLADSARHLPWPTLVEALEVLRDIHEHARPLINDRGVLTVENGDNGPLRRAFERLNELFKGEKE